RTNCRSRSSKHSHLSQQPRSALPNDGRLQKSRAILSAGLEDSRKSSGTKQSGPGVEHWWVGRPVSARKRLRQGSTLGPKCLAAFRKEIRTDAPNDGDRVQ